MLPSYSMWNYSKIQSTVIYVHSANNLGRLFVVELGHSPPFSKLPEMEVALQNYGIRIGFRICFQEQANTRRFITNQSLILWLLLSSALMDKSDGGIKQCINYPPFNLRSKGCSDGNHSYKTNKTVTTTES